MEDNFRIFENERELINQLREGKNLPVEYLENVLHNDLKEILDCYLPESVNMKNAYQETKSLILKDNFEIEDNYLWFSSMIGCLKEFSISLRIKMFHTPSDVRKELEKVIDDSFDEYLQKFRNMNQKK